MSKMIIDFIMRFRKITLAVILGITVVFGYGITKMGFYTQFMELFPQNHPYVQIHKKFMDYFGGANVAYLVLEVKDGDIFNQKTLEKIVRIQESVELIPGINPYQIFSLASPRVMITREISGGISTGRLMQEVPTNPGDMADFKADVFTNPAYGLYVSTDLKALRLEASFLEGRLDYTELFTHFMNIRKNEEDANHKIYLAGEPILYGWIYQHVPEMVTILIISVVFLIALLFFFCGRQPVWWVPLIGASLSATWGLGTSGFLGYQFDPLIIVVPFLFTAKAMSHGVQWLNRFGHEFRRLNDVKEASRLTGHSLLGPCFIGVVTDACGVLIVALIPIPILQHLSILGFFWGMSAIITVGLFNPVFVSFLSLKGEKFVENPHWTFLTNFMGGMAKFSITRHGKVVLILGAVVVLALGINGFARVPIGDANPGSPVLWSDSDYNRSVGAINKRFLGIEKMYVQIRGESMGKEITIAHPDVIRAMDSHLNHLVNQGAVAMGTSAADFIREINKLSHGNDPKWDIIPTTMQEIFMLIAIYQMGAAPEDMDKYITPQFQDANVMLYLRDHKGDTLKKVINDIKFWIDQPKNKVMMPSPDDPNKLVPRVTFVPAGGIGGILAAAIEHIEKANNALVAGILVFTFFCCVVLFRSFVAGFIFVISLVLANFTAFAYMAWQGIGLNINTVPVVSLGVGLGVDYGLYIVSRIKELIIAGATWEKGIIEGVSSTGRAVFYMATMMSGSVFFWWFSPLRFQAEMGFLLAILMMVNMFVGVLLLPALVHMLKPKFITRDIPTGDIKHAVV
jgi:hypothetical protein